MESVLGLCGDEGKGFHEISTKKEYSHRREIIILEDVRETPSLMVKILPGKAYVANRK